MNATQSLKFSDHCYMIVRCFCGATFHGEGATADVDVKLKAWSCEHVNCADKKREGNKIFWMSFCDSSLPKGSQFLGACLIKVTAEEADEAMIDVMLNFPVAQPDAEWIAAATTKAWRLGCNPGGQIATMEVDPNNTNLSRYKFGVLMDRAAIEKLDNGLLP